MLLEIESTMHCIDLLDSELEKNTRDEEKNQLHLNIFLRKRCKNHHMILTIL